MKGLSNGKKGFLISYKEVVEKLNIPLEYFLGDLNRCGEDVVLQLIKKEMFSMHNGVVDFDSAKKQERYIFLKIEDLEKKLGITMENPLFITCFKEGKELRWSGVMDQLLLAREMLGKENFLWIGQGNPLEDYHHCEFVETEW